MPRTLFCVRIGITICSRHLKFLFHRRYDLDRATAVYYEGPFEHESAPPEVNIVIQHCGVDGLFIRAFNAPVRIQMQSVRSCVYAHNLKT